MEFWIWKRFNVYKTHSSYTHSFIDTDNQLVNESRRQRFTQNYDFYRHSFHKILIWYGCSCHYVNLKGP